MLEGEIINGYRILQNFSCAGGGLSKWTFAKKNGKEYFFKEFLFPTFPLPDALGSEAIKKQKRLECEKFEQHHKTLMGKLNSKSIEGGNLIIALDFFRHKSKYYKVTEKIDVSSLSIEKFASLPFDKKKLLLTTITHSLSILHKENIVHGDLKPDNVLIKQTETGKFTSKLIDFDNAYISEKPPEISEEVVGDMVYYSPELARYIIDSEATLGKELTLKSDIFALGLLFHIYWTGKLPDFDIEKYGYACSYVNSGNEIKISYGKIPNKLVDLLNKMLYADFSKRPDINKVFNEVKNIDEVVTIPKVEEPPKPPKEESGSKFRGRLLTQLETAEEKRKREEEKFKRKK
jgi:serine/threonine protein kinase